MSTAERFREAVERKELAAAAELLAPDVVFHSPVTFHPFLGRETVSALLGEVAQVGLPIGRGDVGRAGHGEFAQQQDKP